MPAWVWWVLVGAAVWAAVAVPTALLWGRVIALRDRPDETRWQ